MEYRRDKLKKGRTITGLIHKEENSKFPDLRNLRNPTLTITAFYEAVSLRRTWQLVAGG
jgi:hypothetical protein